jgi:dihydrodipicolinate synthase/N-acetylneuraminate lyase
MIEWSGVFHIMATPFTDGGELDASGLPRLVEAALATGITGVTLLGIAGEAHRLTDEERRRVVEGVVKEVRRRGWIDSARVRPPAPALDAGTLDELGEILRAVGA